MSTHMDLIRESIIRDMAEGVMTIGFDGVITSVNEAAVHILGKSAAELEGQRFARCFFEYPENDRFNQTVLDAVYDTTTSHKNIVPYFTGEVTRQLHVTTSFLRSGEERVGVIAVISDISELAELRDAVKAMERIKALNTQLELRNQLLSETFGRFLSDEIVRQLLDTPDGLALGGKKRTLTVMMSDLRGFTAMSERMEAQSLITMLNHYLGEMTEVIQRRNGTIIEFIGDGIMAIFGAPALSETHAADAVAAAVEMQARMEEINRWNEERGYPTLEMGIGLNTGEVIVGNIGSEKRTKYGVVGSNVNLCGRIESYTVGGQILISPRTRAEANAELEVVQEQDIYPKGVQIPLRIAQVTAIGAPYNVACHEHFDTPTPLREGAAVTFFSIDGKHCSDEGESGTITGLSKSGATLRTAAPLKVFDNIQVEAGGKLLAKVIAADGEDFTLRFTSIPPGFPAWSQQLH